MKLFKFSSTKGLPEEVDLKEPQEHKSLLMSCNSDVESYNNKIIEDKEKSEYAQIVSEGHLVYEESQAERLIRLKAKEFIEIIKNHYINDTGKNYESNECRIKADKQVIEEASTIMFEAIVKARVGGNIPETQMESYIKYLHDRIDQLAVGYSKIQEPTANPGIKNIKNNKKLISESQLHKEKENNNGN